MTQICLTLVNKRGLHARASAALAQLASQYDAEIVIRKDDVHASATSILDLLMLGAACGETVCVSASGSQAEEAMKAVADLVAQGFGETD